MRLALVTTDYPPDKGGLEAYSHRISRALPGNLLAYAVVGTDKRRGDLPEPAPPCRLLAYRGRGRMSALLWSSRSVFALRLAGRIDATLHMQWSTALAPYVLGRLGFRMPYAILIHGAELLDPGRPLLNAIKARIFADAYAVVAGSAATAGLFRSLRLPYRRLEIIHYGNPLQDEADRTHETDAPITKVQPKGPVQLLCMHRLVPRKGTDLLIEALSALRNLRWTLRIVGQGEEALTLRAKVEGMGLSDRIFFEGPINDGDKAALYRSADLFILPSLPPLGNNHMEGLGLTLLEAQSQGLPVLAARTGGIPEGVNEGVTGVLFRAGDREDLKVKLRELIEHPETLPALGKAGPSWVRERFDWDQSLEKLSRLLQGMDQSR